VNGITQVFRITPFIGFRIENRLKDVVTSHTFVPLTAKVEGHIVLIDEGPFLVELGVDLGAEIPDVRPLAFAIKCCPVNVDTTEAAGPVAREVRGAFVRWNGNGLLVEAGVDYTGQRDR